MLVSFQLWPGGVWGQDKELKILPPEPETLETRDGVVLKCTYYAGGRVKTKEGVQQFDGKLVVPIIMLHGWEGQRGEYDALATLLQSVGHAVIVPDLRGHGRSTVAKGPGGDDVQIDRDMMNRDRFAAMVNDVIAVKKFLMEKNNAGELNIELLCVIGADMGAVVAMNWAVYDWSRPQLPAYKQGRDVKALIMLSPPQSFKGLTTRGALRHAVVRAALPTLIAVGSRDRKSQSDARRIHNALERYHDEKKQDLFLIEADTSLQGTRLLYGRGLPVTQSIIQFITLQLVKRRSDFPWTDRTHPLSD